MWILQGCDSLDKGGDIRLSSGFWTGARSGMYSCEKRQTHLSRPREGCGIFGWLKRLGVSQKESV